MDFTEDAHKAIADVIKSLKADADSSEMMEHVKLNQSTDLTPTMRLTLYKILGWHPPYDDTRNSFLDGISSTYPDYYDGFAKLLNDIECHENLIPLIEDMILEGLNPKHNNANQFAQKWAKVLNDTRAKAPQGRKPGQTDYEKQREKDVKARAKVLGYYDQNTAYGDITPMLEQLMDEFDGLNSIESVRSILKK